jgi:hypothetical protein
LGQQLVTCRTYPETFEKCQFLFKFKKGDNFNHSYTSGISRINPPKFGGGLKFEPVDKSRSAGTQKLSKKGHFAKVSSF